MGKGKGIGKPTPQQSISVQANAELAVLRTDVKDFLYDVCADRLRGPFPVCGFSGFRHAADPHAHVGAREGLRSVGLVDTLGSTRRGAETFYGRPIGVWFPLE